MVLSTVKLKGSVEKRREILLTINGLADKVRLMKGCIGVSCYQDVNDNNVFYRVEEWQTRQELNDYLNSPLFSALLGIQSILVEAPEIDIMTRENVKPSA